MTIAPFPNPSHKTVPFIAILVGGTTAGTLDLISAFITFGPNVPKNIASGLLGAQAARGAHPSGYLEYSFTISLHSRPRRSIASPAASLNS
jgi:hypothetical protein